MKNRDLSLKSIFEDNTVYTYSGNLLEVHITDTTLATDPKFLCTYFSPDTIALPTAFYLHDVSNVVLDFNGATLLLHGQIQPFIVDNCCNVTIRNVTVAYDRSPYSEFTILENDGATMLIQPKEGFPCRIENGYLIPYADTWECHSLHKGGSFLQAFNSHTGKGMGALVVMIGEELDAPETPPAFITKLKVQESSRGIALIGSNLPAHWTPGTTVVLAHESRQISSVFLCHSQDICISQYRILNGQGMGLQSMCTENITVDGLHLYQDPASPGIVTNGGDAIHFVASRGNINICNSTFMGMTDDALNVHTVFHNIVSCEGTALRILRNPACHFLPAHFHKFMVGDEIALYRGMTLEERSKYTVCSIRVVGDWETELILDRIPDEWEIGDLVENLTTQPELTIRDCIFDNANSHLRIQTRSKVLMENCKCGLPVMFTGDTTYWYESSPVTDVTVQNCTFTAGGVIKGIPEFVPTDAAPYYHSGIVITDNNFDTAEPLIATGTTGITFLRNRNSRNEQMHITLKNCGSCETDDFVIQNRQ